LGFAIAIKQIAVAFRVKQAAFIVLAVQLQEQRSHLTQQCNANRLVVDEGTAAAIGLDVAAQYKHLVLCFKPLLAQHLKSGMLCGHVKLRAYLGKGCACAHQACIGACTKG
jgi:hypothetical protein